MVVILHKDRLSGKYLPKCAGFLIDSIHILSVAGCFREPTRVDDYLAMVGGTNQDEAELFFIDRITKHKGYSEGFSDNLSILKLTVQVAPTIIPICLPDEIIGSHHLTGLKATTIGYKDSASNNGATGIYLAQLSGLKIISNEECGKPLNSKLVRKLFSQGLDNGILCAVIPESNINPCGPAGAPLMLQIRGTWFVVGVANFCSISKNGSTPNYSGYIRTSTYMNWIEKNRAVKKR